MCIAAPVQIEALAADCRARVVLDGTPREVSVALIEPVVPGDWVIVHSGFALERLEPDEALAMLQAIAEATVPRQELRS